MSILLREKNVLCSEDLIRLIEVRKELPFKPCTATIDKWVKVGIYGVRLETVRIANRVFTSRQAVRRFLIRQEVARREHEAAQRTDKRSGKEVKE